MTIIVGDVEADGPAAGLFSMTELGLVVCDGVFDQTFYATFAPISDNFQEEALAVTGRTREETLMFEDPAYSMMRMDCWLKNFEPPYLFWSDNNSFDFGAYVNYYCWKYLGRNPFGFSSKNINSLYHGVKRDLRASFKGLRKTKHDHNPVNDAIGNAEALYEILTSNNFKGTKLKEIL